MPQLKLVLPRQLPHLLRVVFLTQISVLCLLNQASANPLKRQLEESVTAQRSQTRLLSSGTSSSGSAPSITTRNAPSDAPAEASATLGMPAISTSLSSTPVASPSTTTEAGNAPESIATPLNAPTSTSLPASDGKSVTSDDLMQSPFGTSQRTSTQSDTKHPSGSPDTSPSPAASPASTPDKPLNTSVEQKVKPPSKPVSEPISPVVSPSSSTNGGSSAPAGNYSNTPPGPIGSPEALSTVPVPEDPSSSGAAPSEGVSSDRPFGQDAGAYALSFAEEFNDGLDPKLWNDAIWYDSSNPTRNYAVENGVLKIWPQRDASGRFFNRTLDTDGHFYQTYGYFEIEAKLPRGKGTWPAFWLFNHIGDRRPEMDIMEAYGAGPGWGHYDTSGVAIPTTYAPTVWPGNHETSPAGTKMYSAGVDLSANFHRYAVKWEPNRQTYYFDGKEVLSVVIAMGDPMYIILDLWFGSASGTPDDSTPQGKANSFEINYVRAWTFR